MDRNCEVCRHHTEKGCCKWKCQFEPKEETKMSRELAAKSIETLEEFYQFPFDAFLVGNQWVDIHELFWFIADELKGEQK